MSAVGSDLEDVLVGERELWQLKTLPVRLTP